jgi:dTDP-4-amino-4,6-dideoxygalactose transaminase
MNNELIPFNRAYLATNQLEYVKQSFLSNKISGNGEFTKKCQFFFKTNFNFNGLLTSSCTDALELIADLLDLNAGDEIIVPSYTFVSSALPFVKKGCVIRFCDSQIDNPNMDLEKAIQLTNEKTKAIVIVHYAGVSCDITLINKIKETGIFIIEDAAQCIDSYYFDETTQTKLPLGSIGHFSSFSFHETKNVSAGEAGLAVINEAQYFSRAEIIHEKGTNRSQFFKGETDKYGWVDIGSSYLPSDYTAAVLLSQLEELNIITAKRRSLYERYEENLKAFDQKYFLLPKIPKYAIHHNCHIFYLVLNSVEDRDGLIAQLKKNNIFPTFHYQSLHKSDFNLKYSKEIEELPNADNYSQCLVRLPLYFDLTFANVDKISEQVIDFFKTK